MTSEGYEQSGMKDGNSVSDSTPIPHQGIQLCLDRKPPFSSSFVGCRDDHSNWIRLVLNDE